MCLWVWGTWTSWRPTRADLVESSGKGWLVLRYQEPPSLPPGRPDPSSRGGLRRLPSPPMVCTSLGHKMSPKEQQSRPAGKWPALTSTQATANSEFQPQPSLCPTFGMPRGRAPQGRHAAVGSNPRISFRTRHWCPQRTPGGDSPKLINRGNNPDLQGRLNPVPGEGAGGVGVR